MITFTITEFPDKKIVGIVKDENLIGTIYPTEKGIEVVPNELILHPERELVEAGRNSDRGLFSILINLIKRGE